MKIIGFVIILGCLFNFLLVQGCSNDKYEKGLMHYKKGDISKALEVFKDISKSNSKDKIYAKNMLGLIYTDTRSFDLAITEFKEILSVDPNSIEVHNNLGYAYTLNGQSDMAYIEYSKVLEIDPCNPFATINLKYPVGRLGIRSNVPVFIGTQNEIAEQLLARIDRPFYVANEVGTVDTSHDYRDYAIWILGKTGYKKAEKPLLLLLKQNDFDPCTRRIINWALKKIRNK